MKFQKVFYQLNLDFFNKYEHQISNESDYLKFIDTQLQMNHKKADYKELLQLTIMFVSNDLKFKIKYPGVDSQSRWISKFIYCFKIYLFRNQLKSINFKCSFDKLAEFCLFGIQIYIFHWFLDTLDDF